MPGSCSAARPWTADRCWSRRRAAGGIGGGLGAAASPRADPPPPLVLEHLTPADGLPQGTVSATLQDSQGFIWLGTEDGLIRYDGHRSWSATPIRRDAQRGCRATTSIRSSRTRITICGSRSRTRDSPAGTARRTDFTVYRHDPHEPALARERCGARRARGRRGRVWVGTERCRPRRARPGSGQHRASAARCGDPELAERRQSSR